MDWIGIASVVFICVTANHLGLVSAVEGVIQRKLWIVDCVKCFSFWATLVYLIVSTMDIIASLAVSFLASYISLWIELLEAYIDTLFLKLYDKITSKSTVDPDSFDTEQGDSADSVSEL